MFGVTPWLSFKGKTVLWAYSIIWEGCCNPHHSEKVWSFSLFGLWHCDPSRLLWKSKQRWLLCTSCGDKSGRTFMCRTQFSYPGVCYYAMSKTWRPGLWRKQVGTSQLESQQGFSCEELIHPEDYLLTCLTAVQNAITQDMWGSLKRRLLEAFVDLRQEHWGQPLLFPPLSDLSLSIGVNVVFGWFLNFIIFFCIPGLIPSAFFLLKFSFPWFQQIAGKLLCWSPRSRTE